jgi:tripeptide aminopeptidase
MIAVTERVLDLSIQIQRIPAPTFDEARRARYLREIFLKEGLLDVEIDDISNVYARLPGTGRARPLVVSAHSDTVFPEDTNLMIRRAEQRIYGPGIGDNSVGVAGLFGLIWLLRGEKIELPGDLWLVANVGEEGLGDLRGMRAVVDRFDDQPLGYLILEGMALGQIYHRALGVQRYRIAVNTPGGHSWADYGHPSAINELAVMIGKLSQLSLPENPRTTLNVGVIEGGFSVNTIAAQASLELDLRSEDAETLQTLVRSVEALVEQANRPDVQVKAEIIGQRPAGKISTQHPLVQVAVQALQAQKIQPLFMIGSTDANIPLSCNFPAITIGLTIGKGAHTIDEYILTEPLDKGLDQLLKIVTAAFQTQ